MKGTERMARLLACASLLLFAAAPAAWAHVEDHPGTADETCNAAHEEVPVRVVLNLRHLPLDAAARARICNTTLLSAAHKNITVHVEGHGPGGAMTATTPQEYLQTHPLRRVLSGLPEDDVVCVVDSAATYFLDEIDEIESAYERTLAMYTWNELTKSKDINDAPSYADGQEVDDLIVFSDDLMCPPEPQYRDTWCNNTKEQAPNETTWLHSGAFMGTVKLVRKLLELQADGLRQFIDANFTWTEQQAASYVYQLRQKEGVGILLDDGGELFDNDRTNPADYPNGMSEEEADELMGAAPILRFPSQVPMGFKIVNMTWNATKAAHIILVNGERTTVGEFCGISLPATTDGASATTQNDMAQSNVAAESSVYGGVQPSRTLLVAMPDPSKMQSIGGMEGQQFVVAQQNEIELPKPHAAAAAGSGVGQSLVYTVVTMDAMFVDMLDLLLHTLGSRPGNTGFDFLVITDAQLLPAVETVVQNHTRPGGLHIHVMVASTQNDKPGTDAKTMAYFRKLQIYEFERIHRYSRVLFMDTDMLPLVALTTVLQLPLEPGMFYAVTEAWVLEYPDLAAVHQTRFFGFQNYTNEQLHAFISRDIYPINTGFFSFLNTPEMKEHFTAIWGTIMAHEGPFFFEQSFVSYYFNTRHLGNTSLLNPFVVRVKSEEDVMAHVSKQASYTGKVAHFRGLFLDKVALMRSAASAWHEELTGTAAERVEAYERLLAEAAQALAADEGQQGGGDESSAERALALYVRATELLPSRPEAFLHLATLSYHQETVKGVNACFWAAGSAILALTKLEGSKPPTSNTAQLDRLHFEALDLACTCGFWAEKYDQGLEACRVAAAEFAHAGSKEEVARVQANALFYINRPQDTNATVEVTSQAAQEAEASQNSAVPVQEVQEVQEVTVSPTEAEIALDPQPESQPQLAAYEASLTQKDADYVAYERALSAANLLLQDDDEWASEEGAPSDNVRRAKALYEQAVELVPSWPEAHVQLAMLHYHHLGDMPACYSAAHKALRALNGVNATVSPSGKQQWGSRLNQDRLHVAALDLMCTCAFYAGQYADGLAACLAASTKYAHVARQEDLARFQMNVVFYSDRV